VVVGGGYVGMYTALRLQKKLRRGRADITVVDPQSHMTYQPFLPEASAGSIEPRHVVVPLHKVLRGCRVLTGRVTAISDADKEVTVETAAGGRTTLGYDVLVVAPGSVARTLPVPGLLEQGIAFKTVGEAIYLRNHVLSRLDAASTTDDEELRRRLLTFVVVGGGYAGVEALAELADMARYATRYYSGIEPGDLRWVLVEAMDRIMPEVGPKMGAYTVRRLLDAGIEVLLETRVESMVGGNVELSDGQRFAADTIVWTAGVKPNPMLEHTDLPRGPRGHVECSAELTVNGLQGVFSAGDCASIPDLTKDDPNARTSPSAQHAVRQAKVLADNIVAYLDGDQMKPYKHSYAGSVASLGLYKGVAQVYGIKLKGFPAWFMHRTYHVSRMPTWNRRFRIVVDWTTALLMGREVVALGQIHEPKAEFSRIAGGTVTPLPSTVAQEADAKAS
jgi:NADH dehydrogenase